MSSAGSADAPVRVLIVAPAPLDYPRSGGIASFILNFIRYMPDDFRVELVGAARDDEAGGASWREVELAGRKVMFIPVARLQHGRRDGRIPAKALIVAGHLRHRRRIAGRGRIAQVHAPGMDLGLVGRGMPTVRVVHNAPEDLASSTGESLWGHLGWLLGPLERFGFARAEVFFVNSATRDAYAKRMPNSAGRMHYLPLAIDPELFHPADAAERAVLRGRLASRHGLPQAARWLLFAGRLDQQKDPLLAVRAFAELTQHEPAGLTHLVVVGDGRLRGDVESLVGELEMAERVHVIGAIPRSDLADVMRAADAFLLSSEFEGGPFAVLEALASGLPIASTSVGEVPRMVRHGETGWLVDEHAPAALAGAARWALSQDRATIMPRAVASTASHQAREILVPFYDAHRRIARSV